MDQAAPFELLYEDEHYVAINKPPGILVHRTRISEDRVFVLQTLRDQLGQRLYPIHRLDRGTSGVLILGKHSEAAALLAAQFEQKTLKKHYWAIVRGYVPEHGSIDSPLPHPRSGLPRAALTHYRLLASTELPVAVGRYATARYAFVEVEPATGRMHQIRRHFAHIRHPIIGDKKNGDVQHNKHWFNQWGIARMLLHAHALDFLHPYTHLHMHLVAAPDTAFLSALHLLGFEEPKDSGTP